MPSVATLFRTTTPRRPVLAAFAAWFCALSFAFPLVHAHAGGDRPHSHAAAPAPEPGPGPVHRHYLLFGFALGSDGRGPGGPQLADGSDSVAADGGAPPSFDFDGAPPPAPAVVPSLAAYMPPFWAVESSLC